VGRPSSPSLLEKLYQLIWPAGRFNGNLVQAVSDASQKSSPPIHSSLLFLVEASGTPVAWPGSHGAQDPVVCARDRALYYRRGSSVVHEPLTIRGGQIRSGGPPAVIAAIPVRTLLACTQSSETPVLWVQTLKGDGALTRLRPQGQTASEDQSPIDPELAAARPVEVANYLRILHTMRPDGLTAQVTNGALFGIEAGRDYLMVEGGARFTGFPSWVPETTSLFVVAEGRR
jgi:hypothetical protein